MCGDLTGNELEEGMTVIIRGTIVSVDAPIDGRCTVVVEITKKGEPEELSLYSEEVIKGKLDRTISGNVPDPTES